MSKVFICYLLNQIISKVMYIELYKVLETFYCENIWLNYSKYETDRARST